MSVRDAGFAVEHLRFLTDREEATDADHAAANLSARWLADRIESVTARVVDPDKDARLLSRLLFESRERVEMARDMVEGQSGQRDEWARRLVDEIDAYRASRGWSPHGFGGET
jgi:hypothetical protein